MFTPEYKIDSKLDEVIDERGNTAILLRSVSWNGNTFKPEIRKWVIDTKTGKEIPNKGISFLTENGPKNLALAIIKNKFGETQEYIEALKDREDFEESLVNVIGKKSVEDAKAKKANTSTFYDPREVLK